MICLYCGFDKPEAEFSSEHIIPKALICGGLEPTNPFILPVCGRCNNLCGRFVDRPFIKNWFSHGNRAHNERRYVDLARNPEIPLSYMGCLSESPVAGKTCDNWVGPTGDQIFHLHDPYPDLELVGKPLPARGQTFDPGMVFLFMRATNPAWHSCILKSVAAGFENAQLYIVNGANPPPPFQKIPSELESLKNRLIEIVQEPLKLEFKMAADYGDRFLSKLALGFGGLLLKSDFKVSQDAKRLRGFLWERDSEKRATLEVRGASFGSLPKNATVERVLPWAPGHVIYIADMGEFLSLIPIFYGVQAAAIEIARDRALWEGKIPAEGIIYVIAPGFKSWMPAKLGHYIAARIGQLPETDELEQFIKVAENPPELPPFEAPKS
ncbi:HNH endonuclease [Patescibacteria group bacterium]|nr:HNH endonuclease [Patescibacteria group bacterium]